VPTGAPPTSANEGVKGGKDDRLFTIHQQEGLTMAMGIIVAGFTMLGMLALVIASVYTDDGGDVTEVQVVSADAPENATELKKVA
jgi:hypothetical protein